MGRTYEAITPEQKGWMEEQKVFFVATAPLDAEGRINCSPKGGETFRVLDGREVAYLDLTGSGVETIAHLQENGRMVIMFCAFSGPPRIVRLHGRGEVLYPRDSDYARMAALFPEAPGARAILRMQVTRISDSCGYAVPLMDFVAPRDTLTRWAEKKGEEGLKDYWRQKNAESIDGLEGYRLAGGEAGKK